MVTSRVVTVGATAVDLLDGIDLDRRLELIVNPGAAYFGGSDVTTATGYQPSQNVPLSMALHGETLYAVAGSTTTVRLLIISGK